MFWLCIDENQGSPFPLLLRGLREISIFQSPFLAFINQNQINLPSVENGRCIMSTIEEQIGDILRRKNMTLGAVESATGGLISHRITNIAGSSDYYQGSITSYSNAVKMRLAGVKKETLDRYGAVSSQTAGEMAAGGRKALNVDICIADTGIAGPGGATPDKPEGLFYLGLSCGETTLTEKHIFEGNRLEKKQAAAEAALLMLKEYLDSLG